MKETRPARSGLFKVKAGCILRTRAGGRAAQTPLAHDGLSFVLFGLHPREGELVGAGGTARKGGGIEE